jgi:hypothetical protein
MPIRDTITKKQLTADQKSLVKAAIALTPIDPALADEIIRIKVRMQIAVNERLTAAK